MISLNLKAVSLMQAIMRLTSLLKPVLSSDSDSDSDLYVGRSVQVFASELENTPKISNVEDLALDPKYLYANVPPQYNPLKEADALTASNAICKKCGNTAANECIIAKLGRKVLQLAAVKKYEEASEHFMEYHKHLKSHAEKPPSFPGDDVEICWITFLEFILTMIFQKKIDESILISILREHKNLPPFQLGNIAVQDATLVPSEELAKNNEVKYKLKLEDCNLRGISVLYEMSYLKKSMTVQENTKERVKVYNNVLINVLFYSMNIQKLEASEKRHYLSYRLAEKMGALKIVDFMQLFVKEFIPITALNYTDLAPYKDDKSIFEGFRNEVQKVIEGKYVNGAPYSLLFWHDIFNHNKIIKEALDHNFQISLGSLAEYIKTIYEFHYLWTDLENMVHSTNSIFPFKLENIIVPYSDFSHAKGVLLGRFRDSNKGKTGYKKLSECSLLEIKFLIWLYKLKDIENVYVYPGSIIEDLFMLEFKKNKRTSAYRM